MFTPNGSLVGKNEYNAKRPGLFERGKLTILIDQYSASASEILSGAVQDWDRGTIVGRTSFGKGLVQEQYELADGSALRLTVARYYTPSGGLFNVHIIKRLKIIMKKCTIATIKANSCMPIS